MKKSFSIIRDFFCQPVGMESLGIFRIMVSAFALVQFFVLLPDWMVFYGPEGLLPWQVSETLSTTHMPTLSNVQSLLSPLSISAQGTLYIVSTIYFLSLVGLCLGYKTRIMGLLAWLMHLILNTTGHFTAYGVETFTHIALFYCMVLPVGCCSSLDTRKKPSTVPYYLVTVSIRLIQLHLCIMYFASGLEKAMGTQWWNGEAIWIALQQDQFNQFNISWMAQAPWIPKLLCWGTLVVETLYPFGMFCKRTKKFWLIGIVMMHLFIAIFLGLHLFAGMMIILNVAAFGKHCFPGIFSLSMRAGWFRNFQYGKQILSKG